VLLAACASPGGDAPFQAGTLTSAQAEAVRAAERAYRAADPGYESMRVALLADQVTANWLVRMFVRDVFTAREGRPLGEDEGLLRAAARIPDPVEDRALAEIGAAGAAAVPVLIGDLLRHGQPQTRELGVELLARVGTPAIPALQELARDGEPKHRRAAARALGAIGEDDAVFTVLRELADDGDYTVRADALRGLRSGEQARLLLIDRLRGDPDPFVRRVASQSLAHFPDAATATALIDHLERCKRDREHAGEQAAQASLMAIAGARGPRTVEAWRAFAQSLAVRGGNP
jgi:HEAT repeat protein